MGLPALLHILARSNCVFRHSSETHGVDLVSDTILGAVRCSGAVYFTWFDAGIPASILIVRVRGIEKVGFQGMA